MSAAMDASGDSIYDLLTTVSVELSFAIFFGLGFLLVRSELFGGRKKVKVSRKLEVVQNPLHKTIEAEVAAGHMIAAVKAWRGAKARTPTRLETLKLVVQAFLEVEPSALVNEITGHIRAYRDELCNSRTAAAVLDVLARNGQVALMEEVRKVLDDDLQIYPTVQIYEALLGGYASAGDEKQVEDVLSKLCTGRMKVSARGYALTIKGFLKNGKVDAAMEQMKAMHRAALTVPSLAVTQLVRASCEAGRGMEIFNIIQGEFSLPPEATTLLLEDCLKRTDLSQARQIEQLACKQAGASALSQGAYDALLKTCVAHGDSYALELFERMQTSKVHISERLCVALLSRCAETKFLRFAEEIVKFIRGRNEMTMAAYSALMKVYAYAGLYGKACDLYDQIIAQGLEPDSMMYGCLMKFAVECGRTDLSRELFDKAPSLDIQNYMSLIRAAGRDKNIDRAFQVLQKLKESNVTVDNAAYNCVLDVCVGVGDMSRARDLMAEMRRISKLDIITYNTFLKGFCSLGDIRGAKELLSEMESMGMHPNDVSFNCLINAAASRGMWHDAWSAIDMMERNGVPVDHYTISILMKALKKTKDSKQVNRALTLLDRAGLEVCSDEVLLNTVLETCIRHQQHQRLERVVDAFRRSSIQPSVHTYGSLIKACSNLKRADMCWELWRKMVDNRALEPNDIVLGCMLDALVCNQRIEEAVALFKTWQPTIPPNTIMYSTLIKGFANSRQPSKAMDMWREMQELRLPMNTVVYNSLIDSQARVGLMDEVGLLVQHMEPHGCTPDSITYSTIVKGYCYKGDLEKALEVLRNMQQQRMTNDSVVYNTLLDGCVRHNRMEMADTLLKDMEDFHIIPSNFTLGILVKMYGRRHQLDKAFEAVRELPRKYGFKANAQAKTCLMTACLNGADIDAAFKVFNELRSSEQSADWKTYNAMIFGCCRHGYVEQAVGLIEDAYGLNPGAKGLTSSHGQGLETDALQQLLRTLKEGGQMESLGVPLLNRLRAAQIPISMKLLSMFTIPQK
mmetsp:Transcript_117603/g.203108  ORF Transcript_117603/g.203108 Transcript_117603/m.203108 type:complete len:1021 (-) Transcript_117603:31-3093(-)